MRNLVLIFLFAALYGQAQPQADFERANALYAEGQFDKAAEAYRTLLEQGQTHPDVHYNLANAAYRLGNWGEAILHYRKSLKSNPNQSDALYNLEMARKKRVDQIQSLPEPVLQVAAQKLVMLLPAGGWMGLSGLLALLAAAALVLYRQANPRRAVLLGLLGAGLALIFSLAHWGQKVLHTDYGVVMAASAYARSGPNQQADDLFILHQGTEVKWLRNLSGWTEVELPDGKIGWLPENSLSKI